MDSHQDRRRGHFHRGRRGGDRRGFERRSPAQQQQQQQPPQARDQLDVEQIMREIRTRIAQQQGVELSRHQIQDLAARHLESILDPRVLKAELLDQLRRDAAARQVAGRHPGDVPGASGRDAGPESPYTFEAATIYESHRVILRVVRRLLNPLLKLFFNPNPLIRALHLQATVNVEAAERDAARDRRQTEWNALHYEIVQRLVTEIARLSLEFQALSTRIESLGGRVDFNDRRVRTMEGTVHQMRPAGRPPERLPDVAPVVRTPTPEAGPAPEGAPESTPSEAGRRRRRRRRGRRGGGVMVVGAPAEGTPTAGPEPAGGQPETGETLDAGDGPDAEAREAADQTTARSPVEEPAPAPAADRDDTDPLE